jgi:formylglycine-generating enzyme
MRLAVALLAVLAVALLGCRRDKDTRGTTGAVPAESASALLPGDVPPVPPKGMLYIPPGVLIAGTPEGKVPRVADAEMPGAQVVMKGFFIDELSYPNEAGAIPRTGVTQIEAQALCEAQGKRLCTELEWERACKGPNNTTYPYADTYRPGDCGTGTVAVGMPPAGMLSACKSGFGVRDLHGGVWQWTASPWGRGSLSNMVSVRGGNGDAGDVIGRCANAAPRKPNESRADLGFRCCAGERNLAEVTINVVRGNLRFVANDPALMSALEAAPPPELSKTLAGKAPFKVLQTWRWRPIGNEELVLQSGCAHPGAHALCGIAIGRPKPKGVLEPLGFASSGWWLPTLHEDRDPRVLWVFGGDELGAYRRKLEYAWGRIALAEPEHKTPSAKKRPRKNP